MSHENVEFLEGLLAGVAELDRQALLAALPELIAQVALLVEGAIVHQREDIDRQLLRGDPDGEVFEAVVFHVVLLSKLF